EASQAAAAGKRQATTRVWHRPAAIPPAVTADGSGAPGVAAFAPPAGSRRLDGPPAPAAAAGPGEDGGAAPQTVFGETVDVALTTFSVRALDPAGEPIPGLGPQDFTLRVGRRAVPVRAVDFYSAAPEHRLAARLAASPDAVGRGAAGLTVPVLEPPPRLIVLFVQADLHALRVRGHLKMLPFVERLLAELPPRDRVAVVSFDSHLKLWQDFTLDRERAHAAVWDGIRFGGRPWPRSAEGVSLARRWDEEAARDAAQPERALELVADALAALPGEKGIIFLGWGLGRFGAGGFQLRPDYRPALAALGRARATVFVLDVADAAYHSLELGLRQVAADTGGTYAKTAEFPSSAVGRLVSTLASWYVLTVATADLPADGGEVRVALSGRRGQVLVGRLGGR
ncbi:MAG TPA: hypothetical protein VHQ65_13890, partial [Thermoanaerobaculia bacterium]|nr:hypothetical protein [Thermoanaerobaculia bacterium]